MKGSGICYHYKKGSNLLIKKEILTKVGVRNGMYHYNEDVALIQIASMTP